MPYSTRRRPRADQLEIRGANPDERRATLGVLIAQLASAHGGVKPLCRALDSSIRSDHIRRLRDGRIAQLSHDRFARIFSATSLAKLGSLQARWKYLDDLDAAVSFSECGPTRRRRKRPPLSLRSVPVNLPPHLLQVCDLHGTCDATWEQLVRLEAIGIGSLAELVRSCLRDELSTLPGFNRRLQTQMYGAAASMMCFNVGDFTGNGGMPAAFLAVVRELGLDGKKTETDPVALYRAERRARENRTAARL